MVILCVPPNRISKSSDADIFHLDEVKFISIIACPTCARKWRPVLSYCMARNRNQIYIRTEFDVTRFAAHQPPTTQLGGRHVIERPPTSRNLKLPSHALVQFSGCASGRRELQWRGSGIQMRSYLANINFSFVLNKFRN